MLHLSIMKYLTSFFLAHSGIVLFKRLTLLAREPVVCSYLTQTLFANRFVAVDPVNRLIY